MESHRSVHMLVSPDASLDHQGLAAALLAYWSAAHLDRASTQGSLEDGAPPILALQSLQGLPPSADLLLVPLLDPPPLELLSSLRGLWADTCILGVLDAGVSLTAGVEPMLLHPELDGIIHWEALPLLLDALEVPVPASPPTTCPPTLPASAHTHTRDPSTTAQTTGPIPGESLRTTLPAALTALGVCQTRGASCHTEKLAKRAEAPGLIAFSIEMGMVRSACMYTVDGQQACTARSPQGGLGVVQARRPVRAFNPSTLESLLEHCTPAAGSGRMERLILHAAPDVQNTDLLDMLARQLASRDLVCAMTLRTPFLPKTATLDTLREAGCNRLELTWPTAEDLPLPGLSSLPLPPRISVVELTQHAMDAHIRIPVGRPGDSSSTVLNLLNMAIGIPDMIPTLERPLVQIGSPLYRVASSGLPNTHLAETHGADTRLPGLIRNRQGQLVASPGFPPSDLALLSRLEQLLEPLQHAGLTSIRLVAQALKQKPTQILDALLRHTPLPRPPRFQVWLTQQLSHVLRDAGRTEQLPVLIQVLDLEFWRADFQQRRTRGLRPGPLLPDPIPPQALLARNPAVEVRTFSFDLLKVMALGMEEAAHRRTHLLLRWQGTGIRPLISILPDRICEQLELLTTPRTVAELREEARERGWETMDMNALRAGPEGLVQQGLAVFRGIRREKARPLGKNVLPFQMQGGPRQILPFRPRARKHEPPVVQPPSPSEEKE